MLGLAFKNLRYLLYLFSFLAGWPCVFYLMGWLPHYTTGYMILFAIAAIFVFFRNQYRLPMPITGLFIVQIAVWLVYVAIHRLDTSYYTRILMLLITYLFLELQMTYGRKEFIKTYNFWLVFQAVAGTIGFLLVLFGILEPIFEFREMDKRWGYCFGLFTTNTYYDGFVRNAGFYDEPGALAFWGMYALIINKLFVNNRKVELLLIFGLISTLSMAYFIQLAFYMWFFYKGKRKEFITYIIAFVIALKLVGSFGEQIDDAIYGRFEYNEKLEKIEGDNRSELMEICWKLFKESPIIGHGANHLIEISVQRREFVGANAFTGLATDGILGQIVYWSPLIFLFFLGKKDRRFVWAGLVLLLGFMQRPYDGTQLLYPLMTFTIVLQAYLSVKDNNEGKEEIEVNELENGYEYEKSSC